MPGNMATKYARYIHAHRERLCVVLFLGFCILLLAACSNAIPQPIEDTSYLTPIPEATRQAFIFSKMRVTNKFEAAMAALSSSMAGHFRFTHLPTVKSVEKISLDEASRRITSPGAPFNESGWSSEVWFVVLEGEIQIQPPPPPPGVTATPLPPFHGCNYVMFASNYPNGYSSLGGYPCPTKDNSK
jgi:hypothetical protein